MFRDFRSLILMFLVVLVTSSTISAIGFLRSGIVKNLAASRETPWGIFSSLFVNSGLLNLEFDMLGLALYSFLFIVGNVSVTSQERRRRSIFIAIMVFPVALVSNLLWIEWEPSRSATGSSGIVYALASAATVFAILNLWKLRHSTFNIQRLSHFVSWWVNLILIMLALLDVILQMENARILIVESRVNVLVHVYSFVMGLAATSLWYLSSRLSHSLKAAG